MKIIAVEGIDGAGKSTLVSSLKGTPVNGKALNAAAEMTSPLGALLRASLDRLTPFEKVFWFAADRQSVLEMVQRSIADSETPVLWDRYVESARAYRAADVAMGLADHSLLEAVEGVNAGFPQPVLTIILDLNIEQAVARRRQSSGADAHDAEQLRRLDLVQRHYRDIATKHPEGYVLLDASRRAEAVRDTVVEVISAKL